MEKSYLKNAHFMIYGYFQNKTLRHNVQNDEHYPFIMAEMYEQYKEKNNFTLNDKLPS